MFRLRRRGIDLQYINRSEGGQNDVLNWVWYARQFTDAAWAARRAAGSTPWVNLPSFYLLVHAIELALKAYLLYKQRSVAQIRRIGHDLSRLLNEAEEELLFDGEWQKDGGLEVLREVAEQNTNNIFRYPDNNSSLCVFRSIETVTFTVRRLVMLVEDKVVRDVDSANQRR
jgi:hypothetical protein